MQEAAMARSTRESILTAAAELMRHKGYGAVGMKDIAQASGAPIGSLYHHFRGGKVQIAREALVNAGAAYGLLIPSIVDGTPTSARPSRRSSPRPPRHGGHRIREHVPGRERRRRGRRHRRGAPRRLRRGFTAGSTAAPPTSRGAGWPKRRRTMSPSRWSLRWRARSCWPARLRDTEPLLAAGRALARRSSAASHLLPRVVAEDVGSAR